MNLTGFVSPDSDQVQSNVARMDYAYAVNVTESQYGSWTKLSLDAAADLASHNEDSYTNSEPAGNSEVSSTATCTQLLTQPPSMKHDSIIRELP